MPSTLTAKVFGLPLKQTLGTKHVADLTGTDSKGQRTEGTVCTGMTVATDNGLTWLGVAQLWTDHVDNTLMGAAKTV